MADLWLYWLGPPAVEYNQLPLRLEMRKTLALLAYLSLSPQRASRETLSTLLWPEFDQEHAQANLRRNLFSLSKSIPIEALISERDQVCLKKGDLVKVDVAIFRQLLKPGHLHPNSSDDLCTECISQLEKAVSLYRGDFLEGFNLKDCLAFDEWQLLQRENLRIEYSKTLERLANFYRSQCEWGKAILHARSWLALDRLNESAHQLLMRLYHLSGQRSNAFRQYEECKQALEQELGQPPSPETMQINDEIHSVASIPKIPKKNEVRQAQTKSAVEAAVPLLKTKLFVPKVPKTLVKRPHLVAMLNQGIQKSFCILSAPAGFGKTTLLAEWAAQAPLPIAWVALDNGDNDPNRLMAYIVGAVREALSGSHIGDEALQLLHSPSSLPASMILSSFINDLIQSPTPIVLILDDYHHLKAEPALQVTSFILEHQPSLLHLILSTRIDPPLSLARIRANHQLCEIRTDHLRFSTNEENVFLNQMMGLDISEEDVEILDEHTEGWIAGVKMVSIALQPGKPDHKQPNSHVFIQNLSGSHRFILDYLMEEVLNNQPAFLRTFLMRTSILERFCANLCKAVVGALEVPIEWMSGSTTAAVDIPSDASYQQILEYLEHANLFLIPLDEERGWFRYHHLFADLLRTRVRQIEGGSANRELHIRASQWYEENELPIDAINHAFTVQDYDRAARLVESSYISAWEWNELTSIRTWIHQLPEDVVLKRPKLCSYHVYLEMLQGKLEGLERMIQSAETQLSDIPNTLENQETLGILNLTKAYLAGIKGDWPRAIEVAKKPIFTFPRYSPACNYLLGLAFFLEGDLDSAVSAWHSSIHDDVFYYAGSTALSTSYIARARKLEGRLREAEYIYTSALESVEKRGRNWFYMPALIEFGLADLQREQNDLDGALRCAQKGLENTGSWFPANSLATGYTVFGHVLKSRGDCTAALATMQEVDQKLKGQTLLPHIESELDSCRIQIWLADCNLPSASTWLQNNLSLIDIPCNENPGVSFRSEQTRLTAARVLLAQEKFQEALQLLLKMEEIANHGGRQGRLIEIDILQAVALYNLDKVEEALRVMGESLKMAHTEGFMRVFLDEGGPVKLLLRQGKQEGVWPEQSLARYVDRILSAF